MLTEDQIIDNWNEFNVIIDKALPTRAEKIHKMYNELGVEKIAIAPASSNLSFHNCFPGGYIEHVLRVIKFSLKFYKMYEDLGIDISDISKEEVVFVAMHHDLGKLGYPGEDHEHYIPNKSKWHVENQGKVYAKNPLIPNMPIQDRSLFLLQKFGIECNNTEWISIKVHDSLYDKSNEDYMIPYSTPEKFRSNLPTIIQTADFAAWTFEFERFMRTKDAPVEYSKFKEKF